MRKIIGTILFIFLIILSTAGVAAYVMQEAFQEPITFKEFFEMVFKLDYKKEAVAPYLLYDATASFLIQEFNRMPSDQNNLFRYILTYPHSSRQKVRDYPACSEAILEMFIRWVYVRFSEMLLCPHEPQPSVLVGASPL